MASNDPENFVGDRQILWIGRNNSLDFLLKEDGTAIDLAAVTKMELEFDSAHVVTDSTPGSYPIKWEFTPEVTGKVSLQLGNDENVPTELEKYYKAELILYDPTNEEGVTWGEIPLFTK